MNKEEKQVLVETMNRETLVSMFDADTFPSHKSHPTVQFRIIKRRHFAAAQVYERP